MMSLVPRLAENPKENQPQKKNRPDRRDFLLDQTTKISGLLQLGFGGNEVIARPWTRAPEPDVRPPGKESAVFGLRSSRTLP